jgi:hypothetical protein
MAVRLVKMRETRELTKANKESMEFCLEMMEAKQEKLEACQKATVPCLQKMEAIIKAKASQKQVRAKTKTGLQEMKASQEKTECIKEMHVLTAPTGLRFQISTRSDI